MYTVDLNSPEMQELLTITIAPVDWLSEVMKCPVILSEKTSPTIVDSSGFRSTQVVVTF
jgi:hypothetical protein